MSNNSPPQHAYLAEVLKMNPSWQSGEILTARAQQLGVEVRDERQERYQVIQDHAEQRGQLRTQLYEIRDEIWTGDIQQLTQQLNDLSYGGFQELENQGTRLLSILKNRVKLPALVEHKHFDGDFFECFKQVLTAQPRERANLRERVATSFEDRKLYKSGKRMIRLLQQEVPELCECESGWFEQLIPPKRRSNPWVLGLFLLFILAVSISLIMENK